MSGREMSTVSINPPFSLPVQRVRVERKEPASSSAPGSQAHPCADSTTAPENRQRTISVARLCTIFSHPSRRGCSSPAPRRAPAARRLPERRETAGGRAERSRGPVLDLEATAAPSGRPTQRTPSAPPFATAPGRQHQLRRRRPGPSTSSRVRAHGRDDPPRRRARRAPAGKRAAIACSGSAYVTTPQPSVAVAIAVRRELGRLRDDPRRTLLERVLGQSVALWRQPCAAQTQSMPACLPEQLWREAAPVAPGRTRDRPRPSPRARATPRPTPSCSGRRTVRGAGDGELLVRQVGVGTREREGLERLRSRADVGDERRVAPRLAHLAVPHHHRVHAVPRLDEAPRRTVTLIGDATSGGIMPEFPEVEAARRALDGPCPPPRRSRRPARRTSPR